MQPQSKPGNSHFQGDALLKDGSGMCIENFEGIDKLSSGHIFKGKCKIPQNNIGIII